jgi:hypothetical protein
MPPDARLEYALDDVGGGVRCSRPRDDPCEIAPPDDPRADVRHRHRRNEIPPAAECVAHLLRLAERVRAMIERGVPCGAIKKC